MDVNLVALARVNQFPERSRREDPLILAGLGIQLGRAFPANVVREIRNGRHCQI
jgi:hypothetical protein